MLLIQRMIEFNFPSSRHVSSIINKDYLITFSIEVSNDSVQILFKFHNMI